MSGGARLAPLFLGSLFLAALAAALGSLAGPRAYLPRVLLLGALVTFVLFLVRGRGEIAFLFGRARRAAEPGPATTWILLSGVLIFASILLGSRPLRVDLTGRGLNRLSSASREILSSGKERLDLVVVFRETSPARARAVDLAEIYRTASPRVRVTLLDPDRKPEEARAAGVTRANVILVRSGEVREEVDELTEEALTQAVLRVENPSRTRIAFVAGHGERAIGEGGAYGLGRFAAVLRQTGYTPAEVRLFDEEIPADAAMLALIGPRRSLLPGEIEKIARYLDEGGRLLACLEPGVDSGIEDLLAMRGIVFDSLEVADESPATRGLGMGSRTLVVTDYAAHPIVAAGMGYAVLSGARTVTLTEQAHWGIDAKVMMRTGPGGFRVPIGDGDLPAAVGAQSALPLAVVQEWEIPSTGRPAPGEEAAEKGYARLMVIGDSDWLSGQFVDLFSNRDLGLRTFHWLGRREFLLKIPPLDASGTPLRVSIGGVRLLFYLLQLGLPLTLLGIGVSIWMRRR